MELVPHDLELVAHQTPDPTAVVRGIAAGLVQIHAAGVVHRDLKPQNVRVSANLMVPRLIDLGLAVVGRCWAIAWGRRWDGRDA